ncbi:hypothetical protein V2J09_016846 [Rumex salicifolius]
MDNEYFLDAGIPPLLHFDQPPMPTWHSLPPSGLQFPAPPNADGFFDSALSSIVSSPGSASNSVVSNDGFGIRELIGKLGNICNSGEISPPAYYLFAHPGSSIPSNLPAMPGDSGFAERAARFSSFRSRSFNCRTSQHGYPNGSAFPSNAPNHLNSGRKLQRVLSSPSLIKAEDQNDIKVNGFSGNCGVGQGDFRHSIEKSPVSEQTQQQPGAEPGSRPGSASSKKRKSAPKSKSKQIPSSPALAQATQTKNDPISKRIKSSEDKEENNNRNEKQTEPLKDYIHVRARRGQATDSHSLAERVRREKISERMKLLQDIVPGCNKVTGKALMLEEIINYVQSLQRQVEFLSMKLASTPPSMEFNTSNHFQNDIFQPNCPLQTSSMHQFDGSTPNIYGAQNGITGSEVCPSHGFQLAPTDGFMNDVHQLQSICEGDLHAIVDMGPKRSQILKLDSILTNN